MYSALSLPNSDLGQEYVVIFHDDKTVSLIKQCIRDGTSSASVSAMRYDYENGLALFEEDIVLSNSTYTFDSQYCANFDSGKHGEIVISDNNLYTPRNLPYTPIYLFITILIFFLLLLFTKRLIFGKLL